MGKLICADLDIANVDVTTIAVDRPAVFLQSVDTLRGTIFTIDIHDNHRIVGVDINLVGIVGRTGEDISVGTYDKSLALAAFLFEVYLAATILPLRINHERLIFCCVGATYEGNAPFVGLSCFYHKGNVVVVAQAAEKRISVAANGTRSIVFRCHDFRFRLLVVFCCHSRYR